MKGHIYSKKMTGPLGDMQLYATDKGICALTFIGNEKSKLIATQLENRLTACIQDSSNLHIEQAQLQLHEYFLGKRFNFSLALDIVGTDFQQKVWKALQEIPYGEKISYTEEALQINQKNAVRAVANANGQNKIPIIIPCHRVIGKNGTLTGYRGGLARKQWLLNLEEISLASHVSIHTCH